METRMIREVVEVDKEVFISWDGKEFKTKYACMEYEDWLDRKMKFNAVEDFEVSDLENMIPIDVDGLVIGDNSFKWYRVETKEQLEALSAAYPNSISCEKKYPEMYCIETNGFDDKDSYSYTLSKMIENTRNFFDKLGYDIEIKSRER